LLLLDIAAFAWEVDTHTWIGLRAFERSNLNPNGPGGDVLTKRLGFDRFEPQAAFPSPGLAATGTGLPYSVISTNRKRN
jgi:hypothetical protein